MRRREEFRNPASYYLALASEVVSPVLRAVGTVAAGPSTPKESWRRGLIISHTHIGDVLYRTASLPSLAAAFPNCSWDYLVSRSSAPALEGSPHIASALPLVTGENSWDLASGAFSRLRDSSYDVALCTNSLRHYPDLALAVALGIPNRVAFAGTGLSGLITHPVSITRPQPFPAYFREMVAQLAGVAPTWSLQPRLAITPEHESRAGAFLGDHVNGESTLIACCPTTRQPKGGWPARFFTDALNLLSQNHALRIVLCGADAERERLMRVADALDAPSILMAGELDLLTFGALLGKCQVALTQDSAARHIANAVGTPALFYRNLSVNAVETGVYCESEEDLAPADELVPDARLTAAQSQVSAARVAERIGARLSAARAF